MNNIINSLDVEKLKVFYVVCRYNSFSQAAKKLCLAQSSVSRSISLLEKDLGVVLFERTTKDVKLSDEGRSILKFTENIISNIKELENFINTKDKHPHGKLNIVGGENSLSSLIFEFLSEFQDKYPDIELQITGTNKVPEFSSHYWKIGILGPIDNQPEIIQDYLITFNLGIFGSQEYLEKFTTPKETIDLNDHRIITFKNQDIPFTYDENWLLNVGLPSGEFRIPHLIVNTVPLTFCAAEQGLGLVMLPKENYLLERSNLIEVLPELSKPKLKCFLTYHESHKNHPSFVALSNFLKEVIEKKGWS